MMRNDDELLSWMVSSVNVSWLDMVKMYIASIVYFTSKGKENGGFCERQVYHLGSKNQNVGDSFYTFFIQILLVSESVWDNKLLN